MEEIKNQKPVVFWRGRLPHIFISGFPHFFTLRVKGSIPRKEIPRLAQIAESLRELSPQSREFENMQRKQFAIVEKALHHGEGFAPFSCPSALEIMNIRLRKLSEEMMPLAGWVIMPNHLHWASFPLREGSIQSLKKRLSLWKGSVAREVNKALGRKGAFWQREWYDHCIRDPSKLPAVLKYIENNPSNAGISSFVDKVPRVGPPPI